MEINICYSDCKGNKLNEGDLFCEKSKFKQLNPRFHIIISFADSDLSFSTVRKIFFTSDAIEYTFVDRITNERVIYLSTIQDELVSNKMKEYFEMKSDHSHFDDSWFEYSSKYIKLNKPYIHFPGDYNLYQIKQLIDFIDENSGSKILFEYQKESKLAIFSSDDMVFTKKIDNINILLEEVKSSLISIYSLFERLHQHYGGDFA